MKNKLYKQDFEDYVWSEFMRFVYKPGNGIPHRGGMRLKDGIIFLPLIHVRNRNTTQVPNKLWRTLVSSHLRHTTYN